MKKLLKKLTASLWAEEKASHDSIVKLTELHQTENGLELHLEQHPMLAQYVAKCFASLVAEFPNYTELQFTVPRSHQWITVTVKKGSGKTPHELRRQAEGLLRKAMLEMKFFGIEGSNPSFFKEVKEFLDQSQSVKE